MPNLAKSPCTLHTVSNAFRAGLEALVWDIDDFATDIFCWFKQSAARREDYKFVQAFEEIDDKIFLRHVETRWLSLLPVCQRLVEQMPALKSYFLETLRWLARKSKENTYRSIELKSVSTNREAVERGYS